MAQYFVLIVFPLQFHFSFMSCCWECSKTFGLYELTRIHLWYFIPLLFIGRGLENIWVYEQCLKLQAYLGLVAAGTVIKRFTRWKWYCQSSTLELKTQTENRSAFIKRLLIKNLYQESLKGVLCSAITAMKWLWLTEKQHYWHIAHYWCPVSDIVILSCSLSFRKQK